MLVKEKNRREIDDKLKSLGNYVKIDYLLNCLKQPIDFDTKRYVLVKLAELYKEKKMFLESGKMMQNAAPINTTNRAMISDHIFSAEMFVKAGNFNYADIAFEKALSCAGDNQRFEIKQIKIDMYKSQAENYLKNDKRNNAVNAFEKLIELNLAPSERKEVQDKLLSLYDRLGKIKEYYNLKKAM
ncbi:MAG: hypothetical protein Q7S27_05610 [Nanoarchaeota archaeon]|nr:hypothetical protein [Nanoarchaeota archaeon]